MRSPPKTPRRKDAKSPEAAKSAPAPGPRKTNGVLSWNGDYVQKMLRDMIIS